MKKRILCVYLPLALLSHSIFSENEYFSQNGQDKYLYETFFKDKKDGVFVEIGAYDGIRFSNSYFFENSLGWSGVCIEPNPEAFEKLKKNRRCICVNGCITDFNGTADFLWIQGPGHFLSGLIDKYDPRHMERVEKTLLEHGGKKELVKIDCLLLEDILKQNNIAHVDYLSIDTEGGEIDILRSINLKNVDISIIGIETNFPENKVEVRNYLEPMGYKLVKRVGADDIYVKTY